ncbi:MAG: hypothetical protein OEM97_04205 [Acidimicrobiia bacterium]|nr:hypothetical protein [Acidimicrobiia bacterium]
MSLGQGAATIVGLFVILALVVADVVLANDSTSDNAPSQIVRWVGRYTAVVPFGLGVLMGHWFHPDDAFDPILGARSPLYLLLIGLTLGIVGFLLRWHRRGITPWPWAVAGTVLGALLWPV